MAHLKGDVPVAHAYLDKQAARCVNQVRDLLGVWIEEADEAALQRVGEALHFGL